jgi:cell division inhibitor SepF
MGLGDVWNRTLVYFGIAEDVDWDEDGFVANEELEDAYRSRSSRANVRRLPRHRESAWGDDSLSDVGAESPLPQRRARLRDVEGRARDRHQEPQVKVHLVLPRSFNDAQQIADRFKNAMPVILNLQSADGDLAKRLIDFASGLTYALDGTMQRVADRVFLLTPRDVELSAEDRARVLDRGGFFNQA